MTRKVNKPLYKVGQTVTWNQGANEQIKGKIIKIIERKGSPWFQVRDPTNPQTMRFVSQQILQRQQN